MDRAEFTLSRPVCLSLPVEEVDKLLREKDGRCALVYLALLRAGGKSFPAERIGLTERELRQNNQQLTAGQRLYQQLGLTGARGEAEAGYPLVIQHALPHYRALLTQGRDPELALLDTLLLLMSINGDTNVASRGGAEGLRWLQQQATALMQQGGIRTPADLEYLHQFDQQCIERNLSPGGCADLLIVTWFLAQISQVHHYHN